MIPQCKHIMIVFQAHETSAYMSGFEELTSSTMANMKKSFWTMIREPFKKK